MALEKIVSVDRIEVLEDGVVQVRTKTVILEDSKQISGSFHRNSIQPGVDYSGEDSRVQAICAATHTPELIEAFKAVAQVV